MPHVLEADAGETLDTKKDQMITIDGDRYVRALEEFIKTGMTSDKVVYDTILAITNAIRRKQVAE
jgi:hypothetical protein